MEKESIKIINTFKSQRKIINSIYKHDLKLFKIKKDDDIFNIDIIDAKIIIDDIIKNIKKLDKIYNKNSIK